MWPVKHVTVHSANYYPHIHMINVCNFWPEYLKNKLTQHDLPVVWAGCPEWSAVPILGGSGMWRRSGTKGHGWWWDLRVCSTVLTRFSMSVRANTYVRTLPFWCRSMYSRRVAWSDFCCSHKAVYKLLKLIWKTWGCDDEKALLSETEKYKIILSKYICHLDSFKFFKPLDGIFYAGTIIKR